MKKFYEGMQKGLLLLLISTVMVSCSQDLSYQEAINKNQRKIEDPAKLDDATFLVETKSNSLLQVRLAELAKTSGYASAIVDLAKKNLADLEEMSEDLDDLARREKVAIPDMMDDHDQANYYEVSKADRQDFDKNFIMIMKQVNEDNIQRFLSMATNAKDADVRAFAARQLDLFRTHAQRMEQVEKDLLNTY
jgi:putative membrane protein